MSQIGTVVSCCPQTWCQQVISNWSVNYTYQLDAGGTGQAQVIVGPGSGPTISIGIATIPRVDPWASPTSTVQVNAPGSSNPVLLACPPLVQAATFGLPLK
jgi:hypothetical protein